MKSRWLPGAPARLFLVLPAVTLLAVLAAAAPRARASEAEAQLSPQLREDLEAVLKKRVADLLAETDTEGVPTKRGAYSRSFYKVDDATYQVTFHRDTIEKQGLLGDQMKTERLLLTLKKDGGSWKIAKEEVKDTRTELFAAVFSRGEIYPFQEFNFEREGLKVTASNGSIYRVVRQGKTFAFVLAADDLKYDYTLPPDTGYPWYDVTRQRIARQHPEDITFHPDKLTVACDPASCEDIVAKAFKGLPAFKTPGAAPGGTGEGAAKGGGKIQELFDEDSKEAAKQRKENPFSAFFRPTPDPDRRYWTFDFKKAGARERHFVMSYDTFEPWEVRVSVYPRYGPLFAYYSEDTRKSKTPPYELERRDDAENLDYDMTGLEGSVDIALDDPSTLSGDVRFTMVAKRTLRRIPFFISRLQLPGQDQKDLKNPKLFINSIQNGAGDELTWVKYGPYGGILFLAEPIQAGTEFKLRLQFTNRDGVYQLNPSYSFLDRGGWLPFVHFTDMIDKFDLLVRTPAKYTTLCVGEKVDEKVDGPVRTTRWRSPRPVSFPTVIFGDYITDKPTIKAKKSDGTEIPVEVYVDTVSTNAINTETVRSDLDAGNVVSQITGGARDIRAKQLRAIGDQAVNALNLYREFFGVDYPYSKLDLVDDPLGSFYGQSPASIIYLGYGVFRAEGTIANAADRSDRITKFNKDVVAHETGHQWWGSTVGNANGRNYWFVESLAELSAALYVEQVYGRKQYLDKVADWRRTILDADIMSSVQDGYELWAGEGDGGFSPIANIYNKGPFAFHILRSTFGDEKFFAFLKRMGQELKGKSIVTRDIQRVMEESYGVSMDWFFDQWIRGVGIPQYALSYTKRQTEDGKWVVQGTIRQRVVMGKDKDEMKGVYYRAVAPLTFVFADGKRMDTAKPILVQGPETPFALKLPQEPVEVLFNAENQILAHDVVVNKSGW